MKKAMKQSRLLFLLNLFSSILALLVLILLSMTIVTSKKADAANEQRTQLTDHALRFINASGYLTGEVRAYCATGDIKHYNNYTTEIEQTKTRETSTAGMVDLGLSTQGKELIDRMNSFSASMMEQEKAAIALADKGDYLNASRTVLSVAYNDAVTNMAAAKIELIDGINNRTNQEISALVLATRTMEVLTFLAGLAVILLQIVSYQIIRKQVIRPIIAVEAEARRIATGDLSHDFDWTPDTSEIGMLIDSMKTTKWELREYIRDISDKLSKMANRDLSVSIDVEYIGDFLPIQESMRKIIIALNNSFVLFDNGAEQLSSSASASAEQAISLAEGSVQQAASLQVVSASIGNIFNEISNTSTQARAATELANAAGIALSSSNQQLQGMLVAMTEISNASGEIGKIIKTIEDIAFQTNILALNAAVDAARAGEAGKGFAVVADEVRNLANKSADASKITSEMIENSLNTIQSGAKIAQAASNTFEEVMVNAEKVSIVMGYIYKESINQVETITQINEGMEKISNVVQQNSITAEEGSAASEELASQAANLRDEVCKFRLHPKVLQSK